MLNIMHIYKPVHVHIIEGRKPAISGLSRTNVTSNWTKNAIASTEQRFERTIVNQSRQDSYFRVGTLDHTATSPVKLRPKYNEHRTNCNRNNFGVNNSYNILYLIYKTVQIR